MSKANLHIAIATDSNYLSMAMVTMKSLFEYNSELDVTVHLLSNNLNDNELSYLKEFLYPNGSSLRIYDISNLECRLGIEVPKSISIVSYTRLLIATILPKDIDRVLYIDSDTLILDSLEGLTNYDFENNLVAGVLDCIGNRSYSREIGIPTDERYINAGVLLIPLNKWRALMLSDKFINYLITNGGKVHHHDQGIINAVCCGNKGILPLRYNVMSNVYSFGQRCKTFSNFKGIYSEHQIKNAIEHPAIIHFTGVHLGRPWVDNCEHPLKDLYLSYYLSIPNSRIFDYKSSRMLNLEKFMFKHLPFKLFNLSMSVIGNLSYCKHKLLRR